MEKLAIIFLCSFISALCFGQGNNSKFAIIPQPVAIAQRTGQYTLPKMVVITTGTLASVVPVANYLKSRMAVSTGANIIIKSMATMAAIRLELNKIKDELIGKEGYRLTVSTKGITIKANEPAGLFYGVQTLLQLFPKEIESVEPVKNVIWTIPAVNITDYPRFAWRGLMFDVARHFFTKDEVKHYIDDMVRYKFNILHLHLTDDEGWRIEIKSLPRLTSVGAYNVKRVGEFGTFAPTTPDEARDYGGFYTQDDIRELVKYAQDRFVNILPEIDVPGHSLAAVAAYPELSCTTGSNKYVVRSGEKIMDWSTGHNVAMIDNTLCPANEKVYEFLDKVVTEVAQLFPFEYIHMGGDEAPKNFWAKSDSITALAQRQDLKSMMEVQSYFEKRLEKIVESKGKKFMGWDEIMEGGLAPDAAVMSWRGVESGIEATKLHHDVVMSPTSFVYLDYMQSDAITEPKVYATLRLNKVYQFDPLPEGADAKYIKGGQGNLWTEQVYNFRQAEYMTWPRGMAIAEAVWSPKERKDWPNFINRVEEHFGRLNEAEIKYAPAVYDPAFTPSLMADGQLKVELTTEIPLEIYYSFDNSMPDRFYPKYTEPLVVPKDATMLRVITYRGKTPVGRMLSMPISELNKRLPTKKVPK